MVRGPAKPISALGSAKTKSPSAAKLAATPPIVGLVSTEMNRPPDLVEPSQGGRHFGHLHQRQDAFVHAGPAAGSADDDQRQLLFGGSFDQSRETFAHDRAHAAHDEGRVGHAEGDAPGADHAGPGQRRVAQAGAPCSSISRSK